MSIIQALSQKKKGLTRNELLKATGLKSSQGTTRKLEELENCDFIRIYTAYGNRKGTLYQLIDPFVLFYYHFGSSFHGPAILDASGEFTGNEYMERSCF